MENGAGVQTHDAHVHADHPNSGGIRDVSLFQVTGTWITGECGLGSLILHKTKCRTQLKNAFEIQRERTLQLRFGTG